jgi:hypothetical protein
MSQLMHHPSHLASCLPRTQQLVASQVGLQYLRSYTHQSVAKSASKKKVSLQHLPVKYPAIIAYMHNTIQLAALTQSNDFYIQLNS